MLCGLKFRLMKRPARQGPMTFLILSWSKSPLAFLVREYVDLRITPRKSRWSDNIKKSCGIIFCFSFVFHFPRGRNLHFCDIAVLCILHPDDRSNRVITLSTRRNSQMLVMAGFRSSQYAYSFYLVSIVRFTC